MKFFLKRKLVVAALVPVFGVPLAVSSIAQTTNAQGAGAGQSQPQSQQQKSMQQPQGQQGQQAQQATKIRDMRASKIIGAKVENPKGEELGDVQDLIVNADDGRVNYAILAFGGTLGFGEKLFAYPMNRFKASASGEELVLNASEKEMKNAPGFDRSKWPTFGMGGYRGEVEKHFGQTAKTGGKLVRMSEMLGTKVADRAGNDVGQVEDVVVSVTDGKVRYVALDPASDLNMGDQLVVLPMNAIRATGEQRFEKKQQAQQRQSGQSQQQAQQRQPGQPQQQAQAGGQAQPQGADQQQQAQQQQQRQQQQQQAQRQDQDLQLVLNVPPQQLQKARTFPQDQWPNLNSQSFQRQMDSYVASFPSGGQGSRAAGASGGQGQTGSSATEPKTQSSQRPKASSAQEGTQQRQPAAGGQSR